MKETDQALRDRGLPCRNPYRNCHSNAGTHRRLAGMDTVIAMLLGTPLGMAVHLFLGLILWPLLGMFETMVLASPVGMYASIVDRSFRR